MKLLIDGKLSFPPSEISCFRDVTLYGSVFGNFDILIESRNRNKDIIYKWLKQNGSFDFVDDIVPHNTEKGVSLSYKKRCNICTTRITAKNLNFIISRLKQYSSLYQQFEISDLLDTAFPNELL